MVEQATWEQARTTMPVRDRGIGIYKIISRKSLPFPRHRRLLFRPAALGTCLGMGMGNGDGGAGALTATGIAVGGQRCAVMCCDVPGAVHRPVDNFVHREAFLIRQASLPMCVAWPHGSNSRRAL